MVRNPATTSVLRVRLRTVAKTLSYLAVKILVFNTTNFRGDHHGMLHMMFKLGQCAEENWRKLRGFDYLAKVITGVTFKDGNETTNPDQIAA